MGFSNAQNLVYLTSTGDFKKWAPASDSLLTKQVKFANTADSGIYIDAYSAGLSFLTGSAVVKAGIDQNGGLTLSSSIDFVSGAADDVSVFASLGANTLTLGGAASSVYVPGGLEIDDTVLFNGDLTVSGDLIVNGTTTTVNSETLTVDDNIIVANSGPGASRDGGFLVQRYQTENDTSLGDVVADNPDISDTLQSGSTTTSAKLYGGASASDDRYNNWYIRLAGFLLLHGQVRHITDYNGTTKVATLESAWTPVAATGTVAVSSSSADVTGTGTAFDTELAVGDTIVIGGISKIVSSITSATLLTVTVAYGANQSGQTMTVSAPGQYAFELYSHVYTGMIFQENSNLLSFGYTAQDPGATNATLESKATIGVGGVTVDNDGLVKSSGGTLRVAGGVGGGTLSLRANGGSSADGIDITNTSGILVYKALRLDGVSDPSSVADKGFLYNKLVGGIPELFWRDDTNSPIQITNNGAVNSAPSSGTLDDDYHNGASITVDEGPVVLVQSLDSEAVATLSIVYADLDFTGTPTGISIDMTGANSLSNDASDIFGLKLFGITNSGANNSVGMRVSGFDVGIENTEVLTQSGDANFSGSALSYDNGTGFMSVDCQTVTIDATDSSYFKVTGSFLTLGTVTSGDVSIISAGDLGTTIAGALTLASTGAASLDSSAGLTLGGTSATSLTVSKSGVMTTVRGTLNVDEAVSFDSTLLVSGNMRVAHDAYLAFDNFKCAATAPQSGDLITFSNTDADPRISRAAASNQNKVAGICVSNGTSNTSDGDVVFSGPVVVNAASGEDFSPGDIVYVGAGSDCYKAVTASTAAGASSGNWIQPIGIAVSQAGGAGAALTMIYSKGAATQIP